MENLIFGGTLLNLLIICWVLAIGWYFKKRHYLFGIFVLLFGCYELPGPILFSGILGDDFVTAQRIFMSKADERSVTYYIYALSAFFVVLNGVYLSAVRLRLIRSAAPNLQLRNQSRIFTTLILAIFLFGLVSVYVDAGAVRVLDYLGESLSTSPLFSYGIILLASAVMVAYHHFSRRDWFVFILIVIALIPLLHEVFLTSRRQFFAPSIFSLLLIVLYDTRLRSRYLIITGLVMLSLLFFGIQFLVRSEVTDNVSTEGAFELFFAPQLGEFVAIGSIGFYTWVSVVMGSMSVSYGFHIMYQALNAFPFIKLGNILFPSYGADLISIVSQLSPFGGFSIVADALFSFGLLGLLYMAIFIGFTIAIFHKLLLRYLSNGFVPTVASVYVVSLTATVLLKYRSGFGDMFMAFLTYTLLYLFFIGVGIVFNRPGYSFNAHSSRQP